jgi:hypothetical protein
MIWHRKSRVGEAGVLLRGCCFGLALLLIFAAAFIFLTVRAMAAPDLGAPPGGTAHGSSEVVIAAALAGAATAQLVGAEHAVVVLSERDLTVIARARNPAPDRFRNPLARIRNDDVVVSADTSLGPLGVTAVATFQLILTDTATAAQITAQAVDYSVGQLGLPSFLADRLDPRGSATLNLTQLFASNPALLALSTLLECLSVRPDGVHLGFHRIGTTPNPSCP